jgi:hypothetical protein
VAVAEGTAHIANIGDLHVHSGIHNSPPGFDRDIVAHFPERVKFFFRNLRVYNPSVKNQIDFCPLPCVRGGSGAEQLDIFLPMNTTYLTV